MKRLIFVLGIAASVFLASCAMMPTRFYLPGVIGAGESEGSTGLVSISVQPDWEGSQPVISNGKAQRQQGHDRIASFSVVFHNTTDSPVLIVWRKSSLKYNSGSYSPFLQGQKYEDSGRPMDAMVIPPYGTVRKYIFSSQQLYSDTGKYAGWKMRSIESRNVVLVFCVQSRGTEDYCKVVIQ